MSLGEGPAGGGDRPQPAARALDRGQAKAEYELCLGGGEGEELNSGCPCPKARRLGSLQESAIAHPHGRTPWIRYFGVSLVGRRSPQVQELNARRVPSREEASANGAGRTALVMAKRVAGRLTGLGPAGLQTHLCGWIGQFYEQSRSLGQQRHGSEGETTA